MTISTCNNACKPSYIVSAKIIDEHLIIEYSNGIKNDLGIVVGEKGDTGNDGKDYNFDFVSDVEPTENDFINEKNGFSYLVLNSSTVKLFFKYKTENEKSFWVEKELFKGEKGDSGTNGKNFEPNVIIDHIPTENEYISEDKGFICLYLNTFDQDETSYFIKFNKAYEENTVWVKTKLSGKKGEDGKDGDNGKDGKDGKSGSYQIYNKIDSSYTNTLLVVGNVPKNTVVVSVEINVIKGFKDPVNTMDVRIGGLMQSAYDSTIIVPNTLNDISSTGTYQINKTMTSVSDEEQIVSCVFNDAVNLSSTGELEVIVTLADRLKLLDINENI